MVNYIAAVRDECVIMLDMIYDHTLERMLQCRNCQYMCMVFFPSKCMQCVLPITFLGFVDFSLFSKQLF